MQYTQTLEQHFQVQQKQCQLIDRFIPPSIHLKLDQGWLLYDILLSQKLVSFTSSFSSAPPLYALWLVLPTSCG